MLAAITEGHVDLAELFFFLAAVAFVAAAALATTVPPVTTRLQAGLVPLGLALMALGFFVL